MCDLEEAFCCCSLGRVGASKLTLTEKKKSEIDKYPTTQRIGLKSTPNKNKNKDKDKDGEPT